MRKSNFNISKLLITKHLIKKIQDGESTKGVQGPGSYVHGPGSWRGSMEKGTRFCTHPRSASLRDCSTFQSQANLACLWPSCIAASDLCFLWFKLRDTSFRALYYNMPVLESLYLQSCGNKPKRITREIDSLECKLYFSLNSWNNE